MNVNQGTKHDAQMEAQCFDQLIRQSASDYTDAALNMSAELPSYLQPGRPSPFSAWRYNFWRMGRLDGLQVLDVGCGTGASSVILNAKGGQVTGVDVSSESIAIARRRAQINNCKNLQFEVGSAYELQFADNSFDVVVMCAVLHHLDLIKAQKEVRRVLRPGGVGYFHEPVALVPWMTKFRDLIPVQRNKETEDERELSEAELELFSQGFTQVELKWMGLLASRIERFVPQRFNSYFTFLYEYDALFLRAPFMRRFADMVVGRVIKKSPIQ